jgi:hypothetical protein
LGRVHAFKISRRFRHTNTPSYGSIAAEEMQTGLAADRFTVSVSDFLWAHHASPAEPTAHARAVGRAHGGIPVRAIPIKMSPESRNRPAVLRRNDRCLSALRVGLVYQLWRVTVRRPGAFRILAWRHPQLNARCCSASGRAHPEPAFGISARRPHRSDEHDDEARQDQCVLKRGRFPLSFCASHHHGLGPAYLSGCRLAASPRIRAASRLLTTLGSGLGISLYDVLRSSSGGFGRRLCLSK